MMRKIKLPVIGLLFFLISALFIGNTHSFRELFPAQEVALSPGVLWERILSEKVTVQEIILKKRYLNRIDICFAKMPSSNPNENIFLLLNEEKRILFTKRFSSEEIDGAVYLSFDFKKWLDIGKNKKVFVCLYSTGDQPEGFSVFGRTEKGSPGKLYVTPIQNNDIIFSLENQKNNTAIVGSMGFKIYESGSKYFTLLQIILYIFVLGIGMIIGFAKALKTFIVKIKLSPANIFLPISLIFGLLFTFITPPFQVPDEPSHFYRAYQVSEFNLFKYQDSIPKSLVELSAISNRVKFNVAEKTSRKEILALSEIKLEPSVRTYAESPNYIIPYLPQATGIFIGRIFNADPIFLLYLGRIFNLIISVFLLFMAIKITPVFKWLFFLLSIMPMTIYLMSSLSYDTSIICLSFLFIALIFNLAFSERQRVSLREILLLFLIAILLAFSKPPFFIVLFSFLIIPVQKFGNWKKFILIFSGLLVSALLVSQSWEPGRKFFKNFTVQQSSSTVSQASMIPFFSFTVQTQSQPDPPPPPKEEQKAGVTNTPSPFNSEAQIKYILEDPLRYVGIMIDTLKKFIGIYIIAFTGLFGWVDTPLPPFLVYSFFILLIILSLSDSATGIKISLFRKGILLAIFLAGFILVETSMYLYCNPVGVNMIQAVQGRYFIALSPLLFVILYNNKISDFLNNALVPESQRTLKTRGNKRKKSDAQTVKPELLYSKSFPWLIIGFGLIALCYSLYVILFRFYIVLI